MQLRIAVFSIMAILGISCFAVAQDNGERQGGDQRGGYQQDSDRYGEAFQQGMREGESDARHDATPNPHADRWEGDRAKRAFEAGYDRGYDRVQSENPAFKDRSREAFQKGLSAGDADARGKRSFNPKPEQWGRDERERRAFLAGYNRGYHDVQARNIGGLDSFLGAILGGIGGGAPENRHPEEEYNQQNDRSEGSRNPQDGDNERNRQSGNNQPVGNFLTIRGNNVTWQSQRRGARVFVQEDNKPERLFASGSSGTQDAPWIEQGHQYVFVLRDRNGNELTRSQVDRRR